MSNFTKWVSAWLIGLLVLSFSVSNAEAASYPDVPASHWSAKEVYYLSNLGVLKGGTNGKFNKDAAVTRAQAAAILVRAKKLPLTNVPNPGFQDVPKSHPFYKEIAAAVNAGWFSKAAKFNPNGKLTRAEMAKITASAFNLKGTAPVEWEDMSRKYWGAPYVERLVANGVTSGYTATKYQPTSVVTRAQFAVFTARGLDPKFRLKVASYPKKAADGIFYPQFKDTSGKKDLSYLNEHYAEVGKEIAAFKREFMEKARRDKGYGDRYFYEISYKVARSDLSYISVVFEQYEYAGGAHGYEQLFSYNYDVKNDYFMELDDLALKSNYKRAVIDRINAQARNLERQGRIGSWDGLYSLDEHQYQFYMKPDGFVMYFNPYEYGSYADSIREFTLPYSLIR